MPHPRPTKSQTTSSIPAIRTVARLPADAHAHWRVWGTDLVVGDRISDNGFREQKTHFAAVTELKDTMTD